MRMKTRFLAGLLSVLMVMGLLAGCGGSSSSSEAPAESGAAPASAAGEESAAPAGEGGTISLWTVFTGSDGDILREIVEKYNAENEKGITVEMDIMPNDTLQQKLPAAISTNTAPDMVLFGIEYLAPYVSSGSLESIDDFWDVTGLDAGNYAENVVEYSKHDGVLYGVPMQYNSTYLYWNKDLFEAAGLDPEAPPATLDELAQYAEKLTDASKGQYGFAMPVNVTYPQFIWANGGDINDPEAGTNLLDSAENLATLEWMYDLAVNKKVSPEAVTGSDADAMLQNGQVAMYMSGPWQINGLNELGVNYGVGAVPAGTAGQFSTAGGCSYMIPAGTDEAAKALAYDFMAYWLSDEVLKEWSMRNGFPVWSNSLLEDPDIASNEILSSVSEATTIARSYNLGYALASQIDNDAVIPMFDSVLTGASTPADALAAAVAKLDEILAAA